MSFNRRLLDGNGVPVPVKNLTNALVSLRQSVSRKIFARIPRLPWIPFEAIDALAKILSNDFIVWEVGSGYSTLWMANRVARVVSVEANKEWYERLAQIIEIEHIENIELRFEWREKLMATFDKERFDLLFVDGGPRKDVLFNGIGQVRSGGFIYCDNTDIEEFWGPGGFRKCVSDLGDRLVNIQYFRDYVPAMVGVSEGCLIRLK